MEEDERCDLKIPSCGPEEEDEGEEEGMDMGAVGHGGGMFGGHLCECIGRCDAAILE